jgi:hypothetical protein
MRFGITLTRIKDPKGVTDVNPTGKKRLTYFPEGLSNNTCLRIDEADYLLGGKQGKWLVQKDTRLGKTPGGRKRHGARSVWRHETSRVQVTQTVEIIPGKHTRLLDTCLVRYRIVNKDSRPHQIGIRFLLDTFIGTNDAVPFLIAGEQRLCETRRDWNKPEQIPDFLAALENPDLQNPGTVALVSLRLGFGLEAPHRVTLGAWPHMSLKEATGDRRINQHWTLWEVPVFSMKTLVDRLDGKGRQPLNDSAVVLYWKEQKVQAGARREMGFAYGLGDLEAVTPKGKLAVTLSGSFQRNSPVTVTALVGKPAKQETVTLKLPRGLTLVEGKATQPVAPLDPKAAARLSAITWRVRADNPGIYQFTVQSSKGATLKREVQIASTVSLLD